MVWSRGKFIQSHPHLNGNSCFFTLSYLIILWLSLGQVVLVKWNKHLIKDQRASEKWYTYFDAYYNCTRKAGIIFTGKEFWLISLLFKCLKRSWFIAEIKIKADFYNWCCLINGYLLVITTILNDYLVLMGWKVNIVIMKAWKDVPAQCFICGAEPTSNSQS